MSIVEKKSFTSQWTSCSEASEAQGRLQYLCLRKQLLVSFWNYHSILIEIKTFIFLMSVLLI